jgi:hypothetical protein
LKTAGKTRDERDDDSGKSFHPSTPKRDSKPVETGTYSVIDFLFHAFANG